MKATNSANRPFSNCLLMIRWVHECDRWMIPLKAAAAFLSAIVTYIGTMYLKWIVDFITNDAGMARGEALRKYFWLIMMVQGVTLIFYTLSMVLSKVVIPRREYVVKNKLQNGFIQKAMHQDLSWYEDWEFYDTYTKTVRYADTKALEMVKLLFSVLENVLSMVAIVSVIAQLDGVVLLIVLLMVAVSIVDQSFSNKYSYEQYEAEETLNREAEYIKRVAHHRQYAKEVRTFQLSDFLLGQLNDTFTQKNEIFKKTNGKYWRLKYVVHVVNSILFTPMLLIYIGFQVLRGLLTIGSFTVLFSAAFCVSAHLSSILLSIDQLGFESKFYVSKLRKMLEQENTIENGKNETALGEIDSITFSHVYFKYPHHERWILKDVSFEIKKGEHIALVGKNGAGKSTIIKLLLRLYDATEGEIRINGINIAQYDVASLRGAFSAVLQDYQIFNFSIEDNLCLGETVSKTQMEEALRFAELEERIDACEKGIRTFVGRDFDPQGESFSGGECQKLAIARGMIKACSCYIWDEANSALDPFAEASINRKIMELNANKTMIIVTHRLTAAVNASRMIHIEDGEVVAAGSHLLLLEKDDAYRQMFYAQAQCYMAQKEGAQYER